MDKAYAIWMMLGMCSGYHPDDPGMTQFLCRAQFDAAQRVFHEQIEEQIVLAKYESRYIHRPVWDRRTRPGRA